MHCARWLTSVHMVETEEPLTESRCARLPAAALLVLPQAGLSTSLVLLASAAVVRTTVCSRTGCTAAASTCGMQDAFCKRLHYCEYMVIVL
jgi:hypothetical protein